MILSVLCKKKTDYFIFILCYNIAEHLNLFFFSKNSLMSNLDILVGIFLKSNNK